MTTVSLNEDFKFILLVWLFTFEILCTFWKAFILFICCRTLFLFKWLRVHNFLSFFYEHTAILQQSLCENCVRKKKKAKVNRLYVNLCPNQKRKRERKPFIYFQDTCTIPMSNKCVFWIEILAEWLHAVWRWIGFGDMYSCEHWLHFLVKVNYDFFMTSLPKNCFIRNECGNSIRDLPLSFYAFTHQSILN